MAVNSIQIKRLVEQLFDVVPHRSTADEIVFVCPLPACLDSSGNRSCNLKTGLTNCWRCGVAGSIYHFARSLGYLVEEDEVPIEPSLSAADEALEELEALDRSVLVPVVSDIRLPRGFTPLRGSEDSVYYRLIREMAESKRLAVEDLDGVGAGFTRDDVVWEPYAIFPVYEWGKVVYYQGRKYKSEPGEATKRFPARSEAPLGSRYWVYGLDEVRQAKAKTVIVVEAILSVLSLRKQLALERVDGVGVVAVFKHAVSQVQFIKLAGLKECRELCLMFDHDATGGSMTSAVKLSGSTTLTVASIPALNGNVHTDPNDDAAEAVAAFRRRRAPSPVDGLSHALAGL